jgi:hypothetical protein
VSGPNSDYVTKLADFIRNNIPQDTDAELFALDATVRQLLTATSPAASPNHPSPISPNTQSLQTISVRAC